MQSYKLSVDAEKDLSDVARYTLNKWGKKTFEQYRSGLKATFISIAKDEVVRRSFSKKHPELFVTKYRYHYVFYVRKDAFEPIIVGVIHERRDIVSRLGERLG